MKSIKNKGLFSLITSLFLVTIGFSQSEDISQLLKESSENVEKEI
jgi:hypothetical protein